MMLNQEDILEKDSLSERRSIPRWEITESVSCHIHGSYGSWESDLRDLNCSGLCLSTIRDVDPEQKMTLSFEAYNGEKIQVNGRVVWTEAEEFHNRVGIHFYNTDEKTFELITQHINSVYPSSFQKHVFEGWD